VNARRINNIFIIIKTRRVHLIHKIQLMKWDGIIVYHVDISRVSVPAIAKQIVKKT